LTTDTQLTMAEVLQTAEAKKVRRRLEYAYEPIPSFACFDDCSACCFNSAETSMIEFANILDHMKTLPEEQLNKVIRKTVLYEFLHLVTLDHKCPFLEGGKCSVYEVRPLRCRFFGMYPDDEYMEQKNDSLEANKELLKEYKEAGVELPEEVVTFDIEQCDAARQGASPLLVPKTERELLEDRVYSLDSDVFGDPDQGMQSDRFTFLYVSSAMPDQGEMSRLRLSATNEFLESGTHEVIETMLSLGVFGLQK